MSSNFLSTQKIPQQATEHKDTDTHKGYFCYNCDYFIKPEHCMIVTDEGQDIDGNISGKILPYAVCSLWTPNEKEIK